MATLTPTTEGTLLQVAQYMGAGGLIPSVVQQMAQFCPMLEDAEFRPTNEMTTHISVRQNRLPVIGRRRLNEGISPTTSGSTQIRDRCTSIEHLSRVDSMLKRQVGEEAFSKFRAQEDKSAVEAMTQKLQSDIIYATTASDPEDMSGFAQRYDSSTVGDYAAQVVSGGGSGADQASIWFVRWGDGCHLIYPKGSTAGIQYEPRGDAEVTYDANNKEYRAYKTTMFADYGLAVADPRAVSRAVVDTGTLVYNAATGTDLLDIMVRMIAQTEYAGMGESRGCFYVNRNLHTFLRRQAIFRASVELTLEEARTGGAEETFQNPRLFNHPIKIVDALTNAESPI